MSEIQSFDIQYDEDYAGCPRVGDFPLIKEHQIVGGNKQVTNLERIQITFDYPLSQATTRQFFKQGGFTLYDFYHAVWEGYVKIYAEEDQAVGDPGMISGMLNCDCSQGPHGIWGHYMDDLFLEGFREVEPGVFKLGIGS